MPPDAAPTAAEPSGDGRTGGRTSGEPRRAAVPPPRPAPDVEAVPPESDDERAEDQPAGPATPVTDAGGLTERERGILDFEQQWWRHAGAKEQAIRDRFGLSATRYYQLLNALLDNPAALAAEPVLVRRLQRLRSSRARNRRR